ncbi:Hypothetical Protein FCC1311_096512 [Hondaea fermentalgiana]|uniref:Uncharacterized protein n=1 Tax=Hondaea fermentalgiana TaxID=2315210 RepID=A0A2R5GUI7_9STRA|nr:Hypothetical Protein FCC1311_096512 [Hondaea fermentalgiana]|eukprot:GBG33428.1 Hypothetical Protein FCC1311_096512 [Hondaea fermentalgiana]
MSLSPFRRGCLLAFSLMALTYACFMVLERTYMFDDSRVFAERESEYAHENNTTSSSWMLNPPSLSELSHQASIGTRWVTLLDGSVSPRAFKRHMFTKHQNGNIAWLEMSVLATPGAPEELLTWAKDLGVMIHPVPSLTCKNTTAPASQRHHMARVYAWCLTGGPIVFTRAHTLILRDLRQFESRCRSDVAYCGPGAFENLPEFEIDSGIFMARPHEAHCQALRSMAENSTQHPQDCEKGILNLYFDPVNRTVLDFRTSPHKKLA